MSRWLYRTCGYIAQGCFPQAKKKNTLFLEAPNLWVRCSRLFFFPEKRAPDFLRGCGRGWAFGEPCESTGGYVCGLVKYLLAHSHKDSDSLTRISSVYRSNLPKKPAACELAAPGKPSAADEEYKEDELVLLVPQDGLQLWLSAKHGPTPLEDEQARLQHWSAHPAQRNAPIKEQRSLKARSGSEPTLGMSDVGPYVKFGNDEWGSIVPEGLPNGVRTIVSVHSMETVENGCPFYIIAG